MASNAGPAGDLTAPVRAGGRHPAASSLTAADGGRHAASD